MLGLTSYRALPCLDLVHIALLYFCTSVLLHFCISSLHPAAAHCTMYTGSLIHTAPLHFCTSPCSCPAPAVQYTLPPLFSALTSSNLRPLLIQTLLLIVNVRRMLLIEMVIEVVSIVIVMMAHLMMILMMTMMMRLVLSLIRSNLQPFLIQSLLLTQSLPYTMCTAHFNSHCTRHTAHCTRCTLHTAHCTLQTAR